MQTISLKPFHHRGQEIIGLYFKNDSELNLEVRKLPAVKWSQTNKCWYVPLSKESFEHLYNSLKEKATIDTQSLKSYLEKRKAIKATIAVNPRQNISKTIVYSPAWKISKENLIALERFTDQLKLKAYSTSTIRTYRNEFVQLLQVLKMKHVNDLTSDDLKGYMVYAMESKALKRILHTAG
jgi:integrase/recombinase XerD